MSESKIDKSYVSSTRGILRIGIILCQLAGLIAVILIVKEKSFEPEFDFVYPVRDAYLFFSIVGFILSIAIFIICLFNLTKKFPFNFNLGVVGFDVLWSIAMIIISIFCAWKEGQLIPLIGYNTIYNHGSFGASAAFGLLSAGFYAVDVNCVER